MIKHNTLSIKKTFSLAVLMVASALVGCGGDSTSGGGVNSTLSSSLASAQACTLPEELCGTWQDSSPDADDNDTFVDGRITSKTQIEDHGSVITIVFSIQLKHSETRKLEDGRTAYFAYAQSFDVSYLLEDERIDTLTQEERNERSTVIKSDFESEKHVECSEPSFTTKTMSFRCHVGFTEQNALAKALLTVEQDRLCGTATGFDNLFGNGNGQPVEFPTKPDENHLKNCMHRP